MGGNSVEFLGVEPLPSEPTPAPSPPRPRIGDRGTRVVFGLWVAGAVLCAAATVQTVFRYRFAGLAINTHGGYDAWGHAYDKALTTERGPRFAIMLWICAGLCAGLAAATAARESRASFTRWVRVHRHLFGVITATLVGGAVVAIGLTLQSWFATYRALADFLHDGRVYVTIGPAIWLALGALACAVSAVVVNARTAPDPGADAVCPSAQSDAAVPG